MDKKEVFWDFIPLKEYTPPEDTVQLAVKKGFSSLVKKFRKGDKDSGKPKKDLHSPEKEERSRVVASPDWEKAAGSFNKVVEDRQKKRGDDKSVLFIAAPPYSGYKEILDAWIQKSDVKVLTAPSPDEILNEGEDWLSGITSTRMPWVLPSLEHCFLRHAQGLSMIRRFLEKSCSGEYGQGIIACDGWGWSFLNYIWRTKHLPVVTLKAFNVEMLTAFLTELGKPGVRFHLSTDGSPLLPGDSSSEKEKKQSSGYFRNLVSYSGGNSGVALAYWEASLRTKPEDLSMVKEGESTIWVAPLETVKKGDLPDSLGDDEGFVLHALLLHNGVSAEVLDQLLPVSRSRIAEICFLLEQAGIIEDAEHGWRVTRHAYPRVKQFLKGKDYLIDPF